MPVATTKKKKNTKWVLRTQAISALKKIFICSPMFKAVKDAAKVPHTVFNKDGSESKAKRFLYRCSQCQGLFPDKKIELEVENKKGKKKKSKMHAFQVDHTDPVIDPERGFVDFNEWIAREFVGIDVWDTEKNTASELDGKLSILCSACHLKKSAGENEVRADVRKKNSSKSKINT